MNLIIRYALPLAVFLLLGVFVFSLPELKSCLLIPEERKSRSPDRTDALIMAVISLLYAAVAFINLGNTVSPQTFVNMEGRTETLELDPMGGTVDRLMVYTGVGMGSYSLRYTNNGQDWYELGKLEQTHADVLKWKEVKLNYYITGGTIYITGTGNVWLGDMAALNQDGGRVRLTSSEEKLCDEQELCPDRQSFMNSSYFDEIYHARTAWEQLNGVYPYEISHPPLGKIIIGIGITLFGMTPFGWRFSGTLLGVLMLPMIYLFSKRLFGGRWVPAACCILTATDFMHFVQTRISTIDTYSVFFIILMYLFMYRFITEGGKSSLALSGLFFGLGAASKWTCLYAGAGLAVIWLSWTAGQLVTRRMDAKALLRHCGFCVVFFVLLPAAIYYLSYIPYGRAMGRGLFSAEYLKTVLDNQKYMFGYHSGLVATHPYSSRWYQWMLDIRPILYYLEYLPDGTRSSFGAFVNPALCWGGLMSLFVLAYLAIFRKDRISAFILVSYLAQILPWVFVTRLTFEYHYFPCTVFLVLALGRLFSLMELNNGNRKICVGGFSLLSTALFALFYPVLSGKPTAAHLFSWLPTWPF